MNYFLPSVGKKQPKTRRTAAKKTAAAADMKKE